MTTKELIRAEIERRIEAIANSPSDNGVMDSINGAKGHELMTLLSFLDTLPDDELVSDDLEEAAEEYIKKGKYLPEAFVVRPAFIAGAEWQKRKMMGDSLEKPTCKSCAFYENDCPFIRGKFIVYPNIVCKDFKFSVIRKEEEQ